MTQLVCTICKTAKPTHIWRCDEHYRCDGCGTREKLCYYGGPDGLLCDPCHTAKVEARIDAFKGDTEYTGEVVCPWCGYVYGDSFEIEEGDRECSDCGHKFEVERHVIVEYSTAKIGG
jgi:hypothetical protein